MEIGIWYKILIMSISSYLGWHLYYKLRVYILDRRVREHVRKFNKNNSDFTITVEKVEVK